MAEGEMRLLGVWSRGPGSLCSAATLLHGDDFSQRERMETLVSSTAWEKNTNEARDGLEQLKFSLRGAKRHHSDTYNLELSVVTKDSMTQLSL